MTQPIQPPPSAYGATLLRVSLGLMCCEQCPARPESRAMLLRTRVENDVLTYAWGE